MNPFSQIADNVITVQHFVGCITTGSATKYKTGAKDTPDLGGVFTPMTSALAAPTALISPVSSAKNTVGTTDGSFSIEWTAG